MKQWAKHSGFTIVELLIVIVVIAILAAITIVAYTGIQDRAKQSALQSAASQASKKVAAFAVDNVDLYPQNEAAFQAATSLTDTSDIDYVYLVSPDRTHYCVSATNTGNSSLSFAVSDTSGGAVEGRCVRNLSTNPSLEANANGYSQANNATTSRSSAAAMSQSYGVRVVTNSGGATDSGTNLSIPSAITEGEAMTYSLSIRAVSAGTYRLSLQGVGGGQATRSITLSSAGQQGRLSYSHTAPASGYIVAYVLRTTTSAVTFDVDAVMVVAGSSEYSYGDGSYPGWSWDGAANNSTSFGPAVIQ